MDMGTHNKKRLIILLELAMQESEHGVNGCDMQ